MRGLQQVCEGGSVSTTEELLMRIANALEWEKQVLDATGLGCEDVICADLNGDGKVDIIGVGRSTKNVKVYWNEGKRR